MTLFKTDDLTPMQLGRLNAALDKLYRFEEGIMTLRAALELRHAAGNTEKKEYDGTIDYNRRRFNGMDAKEQKAYMARLHAKRYFTIGGSIVPKIVFDAYTGSNQ